MDKQTKLTKLRERMHDMKQTNMKKFDEDMWAETLPILLEVLNDVDKKSMEPILQQQWEHLQGCKYNGAIQASDDSLEVARIIVPTVRRIFDDFPIRHLVGVQPISEVVGTVYSMELSNVSVSSKESPFGSTHNKLELNINQHKVEAGSRKLGARWTPTTKEDLMCGCGLDIECEKTQALSQEIRQEITAEVLHDLKKIGGEPEVVNTKGFEDEQILALACRIRANCSDIARTTRRGHGNFVVVSKAMAKILSKEGSTKFEFKEDYKSKHSEMLEVGTMCDTIRFFVANVPDNEILIGYKGANGEADTGYIYCPYVALMTGGLTMHPSTYKQSMSFMTRYGKFTAKNTEAYYRNIKVESDLLKEIMG